MRRIKIYTQEGYKEVISRLDKGAKVLKGKWSNPKYKKEQDFYDNLAIAALEWEINNDLLPDL